MHAWSSALILSLEDSTFTRKFGNQLAIGEWVQCEIEPDIDHNLYAVAMKKVDTIVGHMPRTISLLCNLFLSAGGTISCTVIGVRKYSDLSQRGLDIPCKLTFWGEQAMIEEIRKLLPKRPKDPPSVVMKSSFVQKSFQWRSKPSKKEQWRSHP